MIDAIWTEGLKIRSAKQVKKMDPGAMVHVRFKTKQGIMDVLTMVVREGIHKKLMTSDCKTWKIADAENKVYWID